MAGRPVRGPPRDRTASPGGHLLRSTAASPIRFVAGLQRRTRKIDVPPRFRPEAKHSLRCAAVEIARLTGPCAPVAPVRPGIVPVSGPYSFLPGLCSRRDRAEYPARSIASGRPMGQRMGAVVKADMGTANGTLFVIAIGKNPVKHAARPGSNTNKHRGCLLFAGEPRFFALRPRRGPAP